MVLVGIWCVVASAHLSLNSNRDLRAAELLADIFFHHNDNCTAPVSVSVTGLTGHPNAITCCADIKKPLYFYKGLNSVGLSSHRIQPGEVSRPFGFCL